MSAVRGWGNGRFVHRLLLLLILLLAFALRVYHLEGQSMWSDEGLSLYRLRQPVPDLLQNRIIVDGVATRDANPPLYFLLLHGWRALAGETVFALRYGGALLALLAAPLIYRLGAAWGARAAGLAAALLLAVSPFHVWQAQVLRNYGLLITLNLLAVYALARFVQDRARPRRWLLLWAAAALLGSYTHYFGFFILAYGAAGLAWTALYRRRAALRRRRRLLWGGLAGLLLLLPALLVALERFRAGRQVDFVYVQPQHVAHHALSAFAVGVSPSLTHPWGLIWPALLLAGMGLVWLWRRDRSTAVLLLGYQLIPLGLLQLLSLVNPLYNGVRHLLIGLPPFVLLMAAGVALPRARAWRAAAWGLGLAALAIQLNWLHAQFTDARLVRDDVRGAAVYLTQHAAAGDLIVLHDTLIGFTFDYYYAGAAPWRAIPLYGQHDPRAAQAELAAAGAAAQGRLWFLTEPAPRTGFPRAALSAWARQSWPLVWARQFPHMWLPVRLEAYAPNPQRAALPPEAAPLEATFANGLALRGAALPATLPAGGEAWLPLFWSRQGAVEGAWTASLRLTGPDGRQWAQSDDPLWAGYPPARWPEGALTAVYQPVRLPAGLPPGAYTLWLRLVDETGADATTTDGRVDVALGVATVTAATAVSALPDFTSQTARLGPLRLLGYRLPATELRPGHLLPLDLFWEARRAPAVDYALRVRLVNGAGATLQETVGPPTRADYPTSQWTVGAPVRGQAAILVPGTAVPDDIFLRLALLDPQGKVVGREVTLSQRPTIRPWPLVTEVPPPATPLTAVFGDPPRIRLHGYELAPATARPGETVALTLTWQALADLTENYLVFVHLTAGDGTIVAQADGAPVNGTRLTLSWRAQEALLDRRALRIPPDAPPGSYTLWVGLYDPDTFARPPVTVEGVTQPDGRLRLATFTIGGAP
ncbi:glycosyltransferase family 39 protein [Arthrospira platensis SPKY1]|nr:glycosyltransferase family 39 protein [Arthrospira platensis SPKY1]